MQQRHSVEQRRQVFFRLNSHLSRLSNEQLTCLLKKATSASEPNTALKLGSDRVFAKRVPVTDLEHNNMLSTANYYRLPNYFNFTGGGGGLGVFREIATQIKTTNWVLAGAIGCFPLLYHWRILPRSSASEPIDEGDHREFVHRWNNNKRIDQFLRDKASAQYEAVLLLEHFPQTLGPWLERNLPQVGRVVEQVWHAIDFLRKNSMIHFDCHHRNILTDGEHIYLTDFGLVLDKSFDLRQIERDFFAKHRYYSYGHFLCRMGDYVDKRFMALDEDRRRGLIAQCNLEEEVAQQGLRAVLVENIQRINAVGSLRLDPSYIDTVVACSQVIDFMRMFFNSQNHNRRKNSTYDQTILRRLLRETGFKSRAPTSELPRAYQLDETLKKSGLLD